MFILLGLYNEFLRTKKIQKFIFYKRSNTRPNTVIKILITIKELKKTYLQS
jgi:tRNA (Thr-GGU) A37 N-methylase